MSERVQHRILTDLRGQRRQAVRQLIGLVTDDNPFTVRIRGTERTDLVYLAGYLPVIGDRVLLLQKGNEPPIVLGRLGGGVAGGSAAQTIAAMEFFGHSGIYGGASAVTRGTDQRLASLFGAEALNRSRGGSRLSWHEPATLGTVVGGWAHCYRYISPGAHYEPYDANREAVVLWYGLNDLATLGPDDNLIPLTSALEAVISRARAAAVFEETHASISYPTGTWSNGAAGSPDAGTSNLLFASGGGYKYASSGSISIGVPTDFPGGTVTLAFLSGADGSGASMTFTVDGSPAGSLDTRDRNAKDYSTGLNPYVTPVVKRFTNLTPGTHTIVVTVGTVKNLCLFDGYWIEAPDPPVIVVGGGWRTDSSRPLYEFYDLAGFPYVPVEADLTELNERIEAVCATFDADVLYADVESVLDADPLNFFDDHIHPSDRGHAQVASLMANLIATRAKARLAQAQGKGERGFIATTAFENQLNVIESVNPLAAPLTLKGRRGADQLEALLMLDGRGSYPMIKLGQDLASAVDAWIVVPDDDGQFLDDSVEGDTVIGVLDAPRSIRFGVIGDPSRLVVADDGVTCTGYLQWSDGTHTATVGPLFGKPALAFDTDILLFRDAADVLKVQADTTTFQINSNTIKLSEFGGLPILSFNDDVVLARTAANELTLAAGDALKTDDPTADQHVATKKYVDAGLGIWRLVSETPVNLAGDSITSNYWGFNQDGSMAAAGFDSPWNANSKVFQFLFDPSHYPTISGKTAKMRLVATALSNATDPNADLDFQMWAITAAGGADTITWDIDTGAQIGNTAQITNANLGASDKDAAASAVFNLPALGFYTVTMKPSATLAANSVVWVKVRVEVHYE